MPGDQQHPLLSKIASYTKILSVDPDSTVYVSLSESYRKLGMLEKALIVAESGLKRLPEYAPGYVVLARIKCQQGDYDASAAAFHKALEIDTQSLAALVGCSRLYLLLDNKQAARKLLLTAREISPADSVINKLLLDLPEPVAETAVPEEPAALLVDDQPEVVSSAPATLETATLAELYLAQGMPDRALEIYRNLLGRSPDNLDYRRRIRDIELSLSASAVEADSLAEPDETFEVAETVVDEEDQSLYVTAAVEENSMQHLTADNMSVLDQLNGLLTSIQKRRGDV